MASVPRTELVLPLSVSNVTNARHQAFWVKVAESKKQKYDRSRRNKGGGRGWGNRRSGGGGRGLFHTTHRWRARGSGWRARGSAIP